MNINDTGFDAVLIDMSEQYADLDPFIADALTNLRLSADTDVSNGEGTRKECYIPKEKYGEAIRLVPVPNSDVMWHAYRLGDNSILRVYNERLVVGRPPREYDMSLGDSDVYDGIDTPAGPVDESQRLKEEIHEAIMGYHLASGFDDARDQKPVDRYEMKNGMTMKMNPVANRQYNLFRNENGIPRLAYVYDETNDNLSEVGDVDLVYPKEDVLEIAESAKVPNPYMRFEKSPEGLKKYIETFVIPHNEKTGQMKYYLGGGVTVVGVKEFFGDRKSKVVSWTIKSTIQGDLGEYRNSGRDELMLKRRVTIPWKDLNHLSVYMPDAIQLGLFATDMK